jgi:hypothetical protein
MAWARALAVLEDGTAGSQCSSYQAGKFGKNGKSFGRLTYAPSSRSPEDVTNELATLMTAGRLSGESRRIIAKNYRKRRKPENWLSSRHRASFQHHQSSTAQTSYEGLEALAQNHIAPIFRRQITKLSFMSFLLVGSIRTICLFRTHVHPQTTTAKRCVNSTMQNVQQLHLATMSVHESSTQRDSPVFSLQYTQSWRSWRIVRRG